MKRYLLLIIGLLVVAACSGSIEEKRAKFFDKGKALYEKGDYVRAGLEFKNAIQVDPKFADAYYMLGMVELKARNWQKAYSSFFKATELNPELLDAQVKMGEFHLFSKQHQKAMDKAEFVLEKNPTDAAALLLKASVLFAQDQYDSCENVLHEVIRLDPQRSEAFLAYGQ